MFNAQYLRITGAKNDTLTVLGPWMSRGGDNVIFTLEMLDFENADLTVTLLHKDSETPGNGASTGTAISNKTTAGRYDEEHLGLDELVRYQYTITLTSTGTGYVFFRMLAPVWFDSVGV